MFVSRKAELKRKRRHQSKKAAQAILAVNNNQPYDEDDDEEQQEGNEMYFNDLQSRDICFGEHYRTQAKQRLNTLPLSIRCDGAPLIKTSKQSLWPCFVNIVELPLPVRDYQQNIVVCALWSSKKKPNVTVFLEEMINELKYMMSHEFNLFIDSEKIKIVLSTQYFIGDPPVKSLFLNIFILMVTMRVCVVIQKNNYTQRTHEQHLISAREAEKKSAGRRAIIINGVKGTSKLLEIFRYPQDIIYDYMHLVCLGHVLQLIKRWCKLITKQQINELDKQLQAIQLSHNMHQLHTKHIDEYILF
ncbi:unnamed protein product [Didymodactylos carnosus]|uniref:Transposase n=1 Tax=Didymodactylos carnosus TaxID=1234261 RepID=A0A815U9J1_9BILA|nr:unnamed protein product [Didymodactylos carnosus]CAF4374785.1 unnamed protein product [Didymodactylos carnosus]